MNTEARLTPRETELAELLAWGATKKEAANYMGISTRTAENFARTLFEKAEVNSVGELSAWWFCRNYKIPLSENPIPEHMEVFKISLKHKLMALALFAILAPKDLINPGDMIRTARRSTVQRSATRARRNNSDYILEF